MSSLTGNLISSTYQSLLKIVTNNTASANLNNITDGAGNATALSLSSATASINGNLVVTGTLNATATNAITASYVATAANAVSASNANLLDGLDSTAFMVKSGSNVVTGSIVLNGQLSFDNGDGALVLPANTAPIPVVGSTYYNGSTLYVYNGSGYTEIGGDAVASASYAATATSASHAISSSYAISASRAVSASYANHALLADVSTNALNATYLSSTDGIVIASSSIVPDATNTYTLGNQLNYWKDLFVSTGSIYFVNQNNAIVSTLSATSNGANLGQSLSSTDTGVQFQKLVPAGTIQAWTIGNSMNTARYGAVGVGSETTALVVGGSSATQANHQRNIYDTTEEYSGGVWTTAANLPRTASFAAGAGTQTAALMYGGQDWHYLAGIVNTYAYDGSTWSSRANLLVNQHAAGGFGTQNAAISFGGLSKYNIPPYYNAGSDYTQTYDGTAWSEGSLLVYGAQTPAGVGTLAAGMSIGGYDFGYLTYVQNWTSNVWEMGSNLNIARGAAGAAGTATSAVTFGGSTFGPIVDNIYTIIPQNSTEYWDGVTWTIGSPLVFSSDDLNGAGSSNTAAIGFGGSGPNTHYDAIANTQIYSAVQQYDTETSVNFNSSTGNLAIEGAVSINNVLTLQPQETLPPAALNPNSFAVSASRPYFSDGTQWYVLF